MAGDDKKRLDELEERVEKQETLINNLMNILPDDFGRRAFMAGGAGALAAGAFGAGKASAQTAGTGEIGTDSNPLANVHSDAGEIGGSNPLDGTLFLKNTGGTRRTLLMQALDDDGTTEEQRANIEWISTDGELLGSMTAHSPDNHWSVYTRDGPLDGTEGNLTKRFDIMGDGASVDTYLTDVRRLYLRNDGAGTDSTELRIQPDAGGDGTVQFNEENTKMWYLRSRSNGYFRLYNFAAGAPTWEVSPSNSINYAGNPQEGLANYDAPTSADLRPSEWAWDSTNDRWVFCDESDTVHYFTPDGTV
jgi:hypothetical protein